MDTAALAAIHAVRERRLREAVRALEAAMAEGRTVSRELLRVSGLLERGIDPQRIRCSAGDLQRLLSLARAIEAEELSAQGPDTTRAGRRLPV